MYSTTTGAVTIASDKADTIAAYEPLKDEEPRYTQAQAVYETPQASDVQNINSKQVRLDAHTHTCTHASTHAHRHTHTHKNIQPL